MDGGYYHYWDFENRLKNQSVGRLLAFFGDETFLRRRALAMLRAHCFPPESEAGLNDLAVDLTEGSLQDFLNQARTLPMLSSVKLLILKNANRLPAGELNRLSDYFQHPAAKTVAVFEFAPDFNPKRPRDHNAAEKNLLKLIEAHTTCFLFQHLRLEALVSFLQRYADSERYGLDRATIQYLAERLGGDMELIVSEMEKLYLHAGAGGVIERADIERLSIRNPMATIFDMLDDLACRQAKSAHARLATLLDGGEHPLGILIMLNRFFQQVAVYKSLRNKGATEKEILTHMRLQAFQLKNIERAHCNYTAEEAWHCLSLIGQAEEDFKSIRVSARDHMEFLLLRLCAREGTASRP